MTGTATTHLAPGLWGVLATPFTGPALAVDDESLRAEVAMFAAVPATGLVVLGVFGEGAALDTTEQYDVVSVVAHEAGKTPLVVGLSSRSTAVAIEQAATALKAVASAGAHLAAVMVQVNSADPRVLAAHLRAIHDATGAAVVVQDYPLSSGVTISSAQLLEAISGCAFVAAVKSEAPPTASAIAELTAGTDIPVFGGLGGVGLLDELAAGAAGAMTGFSHPEGLRATLVAWELGGYPAARAAFTPWLPLVNFEAQPGVGLALRKEILRQRGVFADAAVRPPARPLPPTLLALLPNHLAAIHTEVMP